MNNKKSRLASAIKGGILFGLAASTSQLAFAEDVNTEEAIERIEITGSRILREGAVAPSPVTVISGADLVNTGAISIGDALNDLPALGSTYSMANSARYIGTAGLNLLDLRNMGSDRTLVLVNGKRHVSSVAGSASVDVNTIPSAWVERVEIITGGASAVYGADAVTGVVNFVLKKNVEGFDASVTAGESEHSDYDNTKYSFSYGTNFDNDRGNIAFAAEFSEQSSLNALDHPWTKTSYRSMANPNQPADNRDDPRYPDKIYTPNAGYWGISDRGTFGIFTLDDPYTFNDDGSPRKLNLGDNVDGLTCSDCDFFNLNKYNEIQPEFDRYNLNFKTNYELNDNANVYFEAKYSEVEAQSLGQPYFNFFDFDNVIKSDNGFLHPETAALIEQAGGEVVVNRMNDDLGRRVEDNTRETTRFVLGVDGTLLNDWGYDVSLVHGKTDIKRANGANVILANYYNAIDSIKDESGNVVCRDEEARENGCAALDLTRYGSATDEAIDYITTTSIGNSEIKQTVFTASVSNSMLMELPAGDVGFAAGMEYRKEESETTEDDNAEGTFFNALGEDKGDFNVKELFVEVSVPVLTDVFLVQDLVVDAAVRYADYSTIGDATSWKLGVDWAINDELRLRATQSEAIRAPNISELFGAPSETFYSVDDPCKSSNLDLSDGYDQRRANCASFGIPTDFDSDYDSSRLPGEQSGNEDLDPEESTSTTIGLVYQPAYLDGFTATIDYWHIELEEAISTVDAQTILDRCVDNESGVDNQYCDLVTRDPSTHEITLIQNRVLNVAGQDVKGLDFEFAYDFDAFGGSFNTNIIASHLIEFTEYPFQSDKTDFTEWEGVSGTPDWEGTFNLRYSHDAWVVSTSTRYVDRVDLYTPQELEDNPNPNSLMQFASYVATDLQVSYEFENGLGLALGVDNVFDKELPFGTTGTGAASATYDNIGRFGYLTLSYSM